MMLALAAYRPHRRSDVIGRLVCLWTRSEYSHCELVVDGLCYSSSVRDGAVDARGLGGVLRKDRGAEGFGAMNDTTMLEMRIAALESRLAALEAAHELTWPLPLPHQPFGPRPYPSPFDKK